MEVRLSARGVAPGPDPAVGVEGQGVQVAGRDGHGVGQADRHRSLSPGVVTPADDLAVFGQGHRVGRSGRDGHRAGQIGGDSSLSLCVGTPGHHGAVGSERQGVREAGGHAGDGAQAGGHGGLPEGVVTPSDDRAFRPVVPCGALESKDFHPQVGAGLDPLGALEISLEAIGPRLTGEHIMQDQAGVGVPGEGLAVAEPLEGRLFGGNRRRSDSGGVCRSAARARVRGGVGAGIGAGIDGGCHRCDRGRYDRDRGRGGLQGDHAQDQTVSGQDLAVAFDPFEDRIAPGIRGIGSRGQFGSIGCSVGIAIRIQRIETPSEFLGVGHTVPIRVGAPGQFGQVGDAIPVGVGGERIEAQAEFDAVFQSVLIGVGHHGTEAQRGFSRIVDPIVVAIQSGPDARSGLEPGVQGEEVGLRRGLCGHGRSTPTHRVAGGRQGQRVAGSGADGDGRGHAGRGGHLFQGGVAPGDDRAETGEGQRVGVARGNSGDAGQVGRCGSLSPVIRSPADDRAVGFQGHGVRRPGGDRHHSR